MEVKEKSKKREVIKTVAIVFLVVLLVLTFFSNTIMNRSLPEVATQSISSGTINARIRGSGTVAPNESYEVTINQTREVRSVCVGVGDIVSQGDLLFVLGDMESEELKNAQEQLDNANLQYQQKLLNLSREYASEDRNLEVLREDLKRATAQRDENKVTESDISVVKGDLARAKDQVIEIDLVLEEIAALMGDNEAYAEAQAAVTKWKTAAESAQQLIEQCTKELNQFSFGGNTDHTQKVAAAQQALTDAQRALSSQWMAYEDTYRALVADVKTYYSSVSNIDTVFDTLEDAQGNFVITGDQQMYLDAYMTAKASSVDTVQKTAYSALLSSYNTVQTKQAALQTAMNEQSAASGDVATQYAAIQTKLSQANYEYSVASQQLQQAQLALNEAEDSNDSLRRQQKSYEASRREQAAEVDRLNETLSELEAKKVLYDQAVQMVSEKERAIKDALNGKNIDKQLNDLDLQTLQNQIDKAQALVDKYTADSVGTEIKANVSGRISAIHVSAGKETAAGTTMATIDVVDRGYLIEIPVTKEQSMQVRVGDTAKVSNYYWGNDLEAVLESIIADPENPGQGKLLVFRITGDVNTGTNLTLSIGQRSANYDTIIPKSALREDTNGYFVLVITVKSSPLSNRYIATRVDVQVLAEDDTSAAVAGLSAGDFVITTSSKPVEAGSQVRMVENS